MKNGTKNRQCGIRPCVQRDSLQAPRSGHILHTWHLPQGLRAVLLFASVLSLFACAPKIVPQPEEKADLLIMHVNDTHSFVAGLDEKGNACFDDAACRGGWSRIAKAITLAKERGENVLALDAGDMFTGTLFFPVNRWPMLADLQKLLPLDAATLGNHEWDEGCAELAKYMKKERNFPFLAANLAPEKGCPLREAPYAKYRILDIGGHRVGVIGLSNDELAVIKSACKKTKFRDRLQTVKEAVQELEAQGVRRIVLLSHIGLSDDRALARSVDGVDVIVGGHSHSYLGTNAADSPEGPYPIVEHSPSGAPVLVVTAKRATKYLGELACMFDEKGVLVSWRGQARELMPEDPRDPAISSRVAAYAKKLSEYTAKRIGRLDINSEADGADACRERECVTGSLFADAMLSYGRKYGAEIAIENGGGVRAQIAPGDISMGDLLSAFPFHGKVLVRSFTGKALLEALEHGVALDGEKNPALLQVAGLSYTVDVSRPVGKRVVRAELVTREGVSKPLRPKKRYVVVLPEYLASGGDYYDMLAKGKKVRAADPVDVDMLAAYIAAQTPVTSIRTGRVVFLRK